MRNLRLLLVTLFLSITAAGAIVRPPQSFYTGWKPAGKTATYDSTKLYVYMDGAAEIFLEMGFADLRVQQYKSAAGKELSLELFRMKNDTAALGMFLWEAGRKSLHPPIDVPCKINPHQFVFFSREYFVRIGNFSGDSLLLPVMEKLAKTLLQKIGYGRDLHLFEQLPQKGRILFSERILCGDVALRRFLGRPVTLPASKGTLYAAGAKYYNENRALFYRLVLFYAKAAAARRALEVLAKRYGGAVTEVKTIERRINPQGILKAGLKQNLLYLRLYFNQ